MVRLQRKDIGQPDEVRPFPRGRVEIFELDDVVVGRTVFEPGWHWAEDVKPIAGTELCEYHHLGYVVGGTFHVVMADGTSLDIGANTAFEIPPGHDAWVVGDEPWITIDFAGMRSFGRSVLGSGERIVATLLLTDIVDSTAMAERVGDGAWRELLAQHNERIRFQLDRFRGREVATTGDGFLARFDGAARAIQCAAAMGDGVADLGLQIRAGVHTGEVEMIAGNLRGLAVHATARIMALAGPSEVLVSSTTHDLVAGSGLTFAFRGDFELKGLSGSRGVYALVAAPQIVARRDQPH
jgi:class 3 adenylate cyclase